MKLRAVKVRKRKKREDKPKSKPKPQVKRLEDRYSIAIRKLFDMSGNWHEMEKELKEPPDSWYFFHARDLESILYRVKNNELSADQVSHWLTLMKQCNENIRLITPDGGLVNNLFDLLFELQEKNELTHEALVRMLDEFPLEIEPMFTISLIPEMTVVGKKKKLAKVKRLRKPKP